VTSVAKMFHVHLGPDRVYKKLKLYSSSRPLTPLTAKNGLQRNLLSFQSVRLSGRYLASFFHVSGTHMSVCSHMIIFGLLFTTGIVLFIFAGKQVTKKNLPPFVTDRCPLSLLSLTREHCQVVVSFIGIPLWDVSR
jgi:hypothetical protein